MPIYEIDVTQELLNTLDLALRITGDDKNEVFKRLIHQYAAEVLRQITPQTMPEYGQATPSILDAPKFHSKAYKRFPNWANKPHQTNHQIVKAFFACESNDVASRGEMRKVFMKNNPERASYFFENNLNSMATDMGNSHGKCFDIIGDAVRFTAEIYPLAQQYKYLFQQG
ncbi:hypothetical protein LJB86_05065 [Deltaproteobacteria bacterium OttesenSCG-928-M10]|nr:hypothetical protein [Deltaproteobacteria bacterium OttesenSCG-928-M10]